MYQGNQPAFGAYQKLDNIQGSFNGVQTTFPLTVNQTPVLAGTAQNLIISISGVVQEPGTAYTYSGQNIIFQTAPAALDTFFGVRLGSVGEVTTVTDGSITAAKLAAGAAQPPLVSGTNIKSVGGESLLGSGDVQVQAPLVSGTSIKTVGGESLLGSGDVQVQAPLVSGTSIKTVGGESLLGSGNVNVESLLPGDTLTTTRQIATAYSDGSWVAPQWLECNGAEYLAASYPALVGVVQPGFNPWNAVQRTLPASVSWCSVTYGNGVFVAVSNSSSIAATSTDGINWTQRTLPASANWYSVTYGNGVFVAVSNSSSIAATSTDGINWTQRTLPASANWYSVTYGNGVFVAVAKYSSIAATSTDGINWTQRTLPASANWYSVTYGNGVFVAVAYGSSIAASYYSYDISKVAIPLAVYPGTQLKTYLKAS